MKNTVPNLLVALVLAGVSVAYGAVPPLNVTVADSSGKTTYKSALNAKGTFATGALKPGSYAVQFTSASAAKGTYTLVVSAGTKKVVANAIAGDRFAKGGVAMKIDVGSGLNISGQVASEDKTVPMGKNGKPMVWIEKKVGSNLPAHWADSDSAEAKEAQTQNSYSTKNLQDKQGQGSSPRQ